MEEMRYDEQDLKPIVASGVFHDDAGEENATAVFFAKQLEYVKNKTYDEKLANLNAARLFPVSSEADEGAETIAYESYGMLGVAKIIANYSNDLPRADVKGKKVSVDVFSVGTSYGYSVQDIRAAKMARKNLSTQKAIAARRADATKVNRLAFTGDADHNIVGVLNNPNISTYTLTADGTGSSTKWKDKTPAQILRDLNNAVTSIVKLTKGVEIPDTVILPIEQYNLIATTIIPDTNGESIMTNFLKNSPYIKKIEQAIELEGAGASGADMALVYRKDPNALTLEIPMAFKQYPPQNKGLEFVIPCESRTAGVIVYYPLSMCRVEGI